jgi:hypothetical protein
MTIEEYLDHMCDRLMLQFSNRPEMPEMYDWVVMEVIIAAVKDLKQDYVLTHKSHVRTMQAYDLSKSGYLTRADVMAMSSDICPDIELLYSVLSTEDLLKQHRDWTVVKLIKYLEAPEPEQTQPDPP